MFDVGHNLNAYAISFLRIIHLAPGLEYRRYPVPKSMVALLGTLTNQDHSGLELTAAGLAFLESKGLRQFGRPHNDQHELELRDRLAALDLPMKKVVQ